MSVLSEFNELVNNLQNNNSRLYKEAQLELCKNNNDIKNILHFIFNSYIVTGIAANKSTKYKFN